MYRLKMARNTQPIRFAIVLRTLLVIQMVATGATEDHAEAAPIADKQSDAMLAAELRLEAPSTDLLPPVDEILDGTSVAMKSFSEQASRLEMYLRSKEEQAQNTMNKLKSAYENKLFAQQNESQMMRTKLNGTTNQLSALKLGNRVLRERIQVLQFDTNRMRNELQQLTLRLGKAHEFLGISKMRARAQATAQEAWMSSSPISALTQVSPADPYASLSVDPGSSMPSQRAKVSLLGFSQPKPIKSASKFQSEDLLKSLSNNLQGLPKQQEEGKVALKSIFMKRFQDGIRAKQLMELEAQQLDTQVAAEQSLKQRLREVIGALAAQRTQYHKRLVGLKLFLAKITDPRAFSDAEI